MRIVIPLLAMLALAACDAISNEGIGHSLRSWCEAQPNCQVNDAH